MPNKFVMRTCRDCKTTIRISQKRERPSNYSKRRPRCMKCALKRAGLKRRIMWCKRGLHPMSGKNLGIGWHGKRYCKECDRSRRRIQGSYGPLPLRKPK